MAGPVVTAANDSLRAQRLDRGWSQTRLAHELLRTATAAGVALPDPSSLVPQISRWENGRKEPGEFYRKLLRTIYRASDRDLGLTTTEADRSETRSGDGELPGGRLGYALSRASRVDLAVVEDIILVADGLRRLDRRFGAATVIGELDALLRQVTDLQQHSMTPEPRRRLAQVVADVATLLGWLSLDGGRPERAWQHFQAGARAAAEAGDRLLEAFTIAESGYVLLAAHRPAEALVRIEAGEAALGKLAIQSCAPGSLPPEPKRSPNAATTLPAARHSMVRCATCMPRTAARLLPRTSTTSTTGTYTAGPATASPRFATQTRCGSSRKPSHRPTPASCARRPVWSSTSPQHTPP